MDIENGSVDTGRGGGEGGLDWENGIETYTLRCVKQIASRKLWYSTGSSALRAVMT